MFDICCDFISSPNSWCSYMDCGGYHTVCTALWFAGQKYHWLHSCHSFDDPEAVGNPSSWVSTVKEVQPNSENNPAVAKNWINMKTKYRITFQLLIVKYTTISTDHSGTVRIKYLFKCRGLRLAGTSFDFDLAILKCIALVARLVVFYYKIFLKEI